jgi:hypothetical protein
VHHPISDVYLIKLIHYQESVPKLANITEIIHHLTHIVFSQTIFSGPPYQPMSSASSAIYNTLPTSRVTLVIGLTLIGMNPFLLTLT